ncbi:hypothetical protein PMAYCL1PPCAC_29827, partial [Pristionchus mayeri]
DIVKGRPLSRPIIDEPEVFNDPNNIIRTSVIREPTLIRTHVDDAFSSFSSNPLLTREQDLTLSSMDEKVHTRPSPMEDQPVREIHVKEQPHQYASNMNSLAPSSSLFHEYPIDERVEGSRTVEGRRTRYEDDPIYDPPHRSLSASSSASFLDGVAPVNRVVDERSTSLVVRRDAILSEREETEPASLFLPRT